MSVLSGLNTPFETTLNQSIRCSGIGLHTGAPVTMRLRPAPVGTGIVFVRTDIEGQDPMVRARYDAVTETRLGTTLANEAGTSVATVEHLMAALRGCGIDNLLIDIDGPEVPIMDGSAAPFVFLIDCAGIAATDTPRRRIRVTKPVCVEEGGKRAELAPGKGFATHFMIDFATPVIGRQTYDFDLSSAAFKTELCRARTFGFLKDVEMLKSIGLARGGSLENAIVIEDDRIVNETGLRYPDEFVRHKTLDAIGDMALSVLPLCARYTAEKSGHDLNNKLLRALFERTDCWVIETMTAGEDAGETEGVAADADEDAVLPAAGR